MDLFVAIPMALGLGALHSLEPGHGKGVMTAYLISSRARLRDAVFLGFTSAVSHTLSILFLAFVATTALQFWMPEQIEAWLGLVSGAVITGIGLRMVYLRMNPPVVSLGRIGTAADETYVCGHGHVHHISELATEGGHAHRHSHTHSHGHSHGTAHAHGHSGALAAVATQERSARRLLTIGVLTGLIPCPSALVMLLAAISADQITMGVGLVVAFSIGGALALSLLGILLLKAEHKVRFLERRRFGEAMATVSAGIIVLIGFLVTYESISSLGLLT
ncbi:nickel/cobalt exporter [Tumebacillus sp. BK434]|uniref:HoxN/HupN/NixA family nickel/cobalt transporter n=1 Tax=Tumebacillus sp. BK434 TaxID=2512169 RepID=UPI001042D680|nr:sulfite exporter TauE/SafE family protein [Tumebacillus sp. BK434]TCP59470.1 nickel/cobalt exporter [Tumebacillus sp. BK434]